VNDIANVIQDILPLSAFVVKRHVEGFKGIQNVSNVDLRATCNTNTKVWKVQSNEVLQKIQDFFAWCWKSGCARTLIEGVQDDILCWLLLESEHLLQTFSECAIVRLLRSSIVLRIQVRQDVVARIGFCTELGKEGSEEASDALLCDVVEIKIIITHEGETPIGFLLDLLNDRRAGWEHEDINADLKDDVG
jgi:hypothetical protein